MAYCPQCTTEVAPEARYCYGCGAQLIKLGDHSDVAPRVDRFHLSQYESDLVSGGIMRWINRLYGPRYGEIRRIIIDLPWPPAPMELICATELDAVEIVTAPGVADGRWAAPMLGVLQDLQRQQEEGQK